MEIDTEKTRAYYQKFPLYSSDDCRCEGCVNFRRWTKRANPAIKEFFQKIGIDSLLYYTELGLPYPVGRNARYLGAYCVNGIILKNPVFPESAEQLSVLPEEFQLYIDANAPEISLLSKDFPRPVIAFGFSATLPWISIYQN